LKRVGVRLRVAPRPLIDSTGMAATYLVGENRTRTLFRRKHRRRQLFRTSEAMEARNDHANGDRPL
jgi:hypothetical protein